MFESLRAIASPKSVIIMLLMAVWSTILSAPARAEGTFQVGLNQPFVETNATAPGAASSRDILVDIVTAGEVINISACGATDTNTLAFVIETPTGAILPTYTPTALAGKILCANPMTAPITTPYRYTTTTAGRYKLRLINVTAANFNRFDVTVTANTSINPDPTNATGIKGRVSSLAWQYSTGAYSLASATNANYYVLTPGGYPGTNYVWQLDLNALAGNGYSIAANNKGVDAPRSGFSTDVTGNSVVAQFQNYINYPAIAGPPPSSAPAVTGFRFIDNAGQDYAISPGNTTGVQDSGFFQFTAPVDNATYSISIDVNKNGIFGDAGDVRLTGNVTNGFNSIAWDGKNNSGVVLPIDSYQARAEVRLGEFHFIANDVETSGGTQNGLTVYEATSPSTLAPTRVYWDDITVLGVAAGGTANTPLGAMSGTSAGYHTWGTFDAGGGGFGNNRFVDTFAFGATTQASLFVAIVGTDAPLTGSDGSVTITPTSKPGDTLALSVTDADLNSLSGIIETVLVSVRNNVTGEMESVTLTETGANTGIFTGSVATTFGAVVGPNNNGVLSTQATDTVTVTYNDALTAAGTAVARTANDVVSGGVTGTVSITPTAGPGDTLSVGVTDADLNTNTLAVETVVVTVVNNATGETEIVTLTETGANTGIFAGALATTAGLVAGTNNDGTMNVKAADTLVVTYADARAANGGPAAPTATNTINSYNPLVATNDTIVGVDATLGATNLVNAFNGDLVNLLPATSANAVLSIASGSSVPSGLTFNTATGEVGVVAGTTAATYSFNYQICEAANLLNCKTATISVTVLIPTAPIVAGDDTATGVDGVAGAANILNALAGDMVNNVAATSANGILSVATGFTVPAGLIFDTATGNISVIAGTAPGTYSFDYQLCEAANPANCDIATISITVAVPPVIIVATPDSVAGVDGVAGAANVANAFTGDTVGGAAATTVNSVLSVAAGFTVPVGLTFDTATGNISVVAGTSAGTYSFDYQICELGNPANCQTASISVTVGIASSVIVATDDTASGVNGANGAAGILNAFTGDTIGGAVATTANATLSVAPGFAVPTALTFDVGTGDISVVAGTAAGTYSFDYQICETAVPANCETASVSVTVVAAPLVAVGDSATGVNGASGASNVVNAFTGDTINGLSASAANTTLSVATGSSVPAGLTFDAASGNVSVVAGTPAGTYTFDYQICETLNPANCQISTVSVLVDASAIVVTADSVSAINGASGASNVVNAFTGDTVDGAAATSSNAVLSVATGSAVPAGLTFNSATGNVSVAAGTPAGTYSFDYRICEALNPSNCQVSTISVTVAPSAVVATADFVAGINGANGTANALNVLAGDTVNGDTATTANATLSVATGSSVPAGLTFDTATGIVGVAAGTAAGTYAFDYQICETLNPTNCQIATASITVIAAPLVAVGDSATGVNGASGASNIANAFAGDTINGAPASAANATLSVAPGSTVPAGLTFDTVTGNVSIAAGTPAGTYAFEYQICEILNPANCQTATISVSVAASAVVAAADMAGAINGASGAANALNVLTGDTVNGVNATTVNAILSIAAGSSLPSGLTFDPATGNVSVAAGTPAGTYSFDYRICEALNPANCQTATASVTTLASPLSVNGSSVIGINGADGAPDAANILTGNSINGQPATTSNAILSIAPGSSIPAGFSLDNATGRVSIAAGIPAGNYVLTYQICEALNPANCSTASINFTVDAAPLLAANDSISGVNGTSGASNVLNILAGDSLNGAPANTANVTIGLAPGSTVPSALTFDTATGNVNVAAGTPAGTYVFDYQICELLNPTNCRTARVSITVDAAALVASPDSVTGINGASGASNVVNAFTGDTFNGSPANAANSVLTVAPGSAVPAGLTFDASTGNVNVAAGTPVGTYTFNYQICEILNPGNCQIAAISVSVDAAPVVAVNDSVSGINGASGAANVLNAFAVDTVNGTAASPSNSVLSIAAGSAVPAGLAFDLLSGNVGVAAGTAAGSYSFDYQICETLNPANCKTATISVTVDAAPLVAASDSVTGINGASGASNVVNAFNGDTVNGAPATQANSILRVATGSAVPVGLIFDSATGNVSVAAGTPAGTYAFDYHICELLNPANCQIATISVTVNAAPMAATSDSATGINGASGAGNVLNVFTGDTVNGGAATTANAVLRVAAGSIVPAGFIFDMATGIVGVAAGTPAGTYSFDYQICEILNPANCRTATVSITVDAASLVATADGATGVNGASGASNIANAFAGDTINGAAATPGNAVLSVATASVVPAGLTFDTATGNVSVAAGTAAGTYSFDYQICELLNPANCRTATITVTVDVSALIATADVAGPINGASGAANVLNVFAQDTVNGVGATTANASLAIAPGSAVPSGLRFDVSTGNVSVDAGSAAGTYIFEYQLCEILNPANCAITTATVTVVAAPLTAVADTVTGINGASGAGDVVNAFTGDTLNGAAATPANSVLSVAAGSSVPAGLTFDAATGNISVAAGTPAGTYVFDYQICELLNPTNCRVSTITVSVVASAVVAVDDSVSGVDGASGAANVLNVFTGDTVNGAAANATNAILSLAAGASVPTGLVFDVANGSVSVAAGTPAGTYSFDYQICEALNPANCQIATATVTVINPAPVAVDDATTVVRGQSVKINVLANDREPGGEILRVTATTSPANGSAVINADGTIDYTPNSSFVGTDSFTYTICDPAGQCSTATVTITVHPSVSALTGTVFQDMDGNRAKDPTDPRQPNWLVEIVRDGVVVATVRTDANGNYRVSDLPLGAGYSVVFRHPTSNVVYGRTDGVTLNPGITAVDLDRPIDPSGVVYDSVARTAIAGARLTIVDANGALLPVACLLDASQQSQITGTDGRYRFDIVPGGAAQCPGSETVYRLIVAGPADTVTGNSTVILPNAGPFDPTGQLNGFVVPNIAAPQAGDDTRYFFNFRLASGDPDVVNNHIPLDRAAALNPLVVTKTSVKRTANVGDLVPYTIVVRNTQNIARNAVDIVDLMPAGFKYVANTGRVDANAVSPVANGRELNWQNLNLPANGSLTISLVLTVGSGVNDGDYVNIASGRDARNGRVISNEGQATVRIMPSPLFDCGEIIGKVFDDRNGNGYLDNGEFGIAGARVATVNGLLITADQYGRYHVTCAAVPNARIGSNFILKLDPRSLPGGYQITTENPRVVRLTRGKISELNFGAHVQKAITLEVTDAAFETGGTGLRAEWLGRLSGLIADVQLKPSTIRLHYAAASASDVLGSDRLKALAEQIQQLWREAGEDSELIIERISAPAKPFNGKE
jgi:large repetitive protein